MEKLLGKLQKLAAMRQEQEGVFALLPRESYAPLAFSSKNYHELSAMPAQHALAFIDGGHAILLDAPHFCLAFLRAHAVIYTSKKRLSSRTIEAYLLVSSSTAKSSSSNQHEVSYSAEFLPLKGLFSFESLLSFDSLDGTIRTGTKRFSPSTLVGVSRRFAELQLATEIMQSLSAGDLIIIDGSLQQSYTNEQHLLQELRLQAQKQGIVVMGLSKTNSVFASNGSPFSSLLSEHPGQWWYSPVAQPLKSTPHISFARLHPKSPHVFMLESFGELQPEQYATLAAYSHDPVFLGYPYGLIEADRAARISNEEAGYLQTKLMEKLGASFHSTLAAKNAHRILDKIQF